MTRQIERTLNLPHLEDTIRDLSEAIPEVQAANNKIDKMAAALERLSPAIVEQRIDEGTDLHCREMDEVYKQAFKAHKEILDLGFNIEARHAGNVLEPAARFLEIALNASKSKSEQKLKTLKLRMDRERLDHDIKDVNVQDGTIDASDSSSFIASRNDLLKDLVGKLRDSRVPKK